MSRRHPLIAFSQSRHNITINQSESGADLMKPTRRGFLKVSGMVAAGAGISVLTYDGIGSLAAREAQAGSSQTLQPFPAPLSPLAAPAASASLAATIGDQAMVLAALNHAAFGPRPGDLAATLQMGVDNWIDQQLASEAIDDGLVEAKLAGLPTLLMDITDLFEGYARQA